MYTHIHTHKERESERQKRVGSVAADPDNLEHGKEAEREAQGTQGLI